jgi:hypothetical protein
MLPDAEPLLLDWNTMKDDIHDGPGLYAFWWYGDPGVLDGDQKVEFTGPAFNEIGNDGKVIKKDNTHRSCFTITEENRLLDPGPICLYVGKSTNVRGRIAQHLKPSIKTSRRFAVIKHVKGKKAGTETVKCSYTNEVSTICKRDTSSQFRAGMEYVLRKEALRRAAIDPNDQYVYEQIRQFVGLTFVPVEDAPAPTVTNDAFKRRFYWEDLLIGVLQPWFNLDGER